jgi:AAA+ superfamily predicted ATPase
LTSKTLDVLLLIATFEGCKAVNLISNLTLTPVTLLIAFLLPFGYLAATGKNRLESLLSRRSDVIFGLLSVIAAALTLWALVTYGWSEALQDRLIIFLHFFPPALTLMIIQRLRQTASLKSLLAGDRGSEKEGDYLPKPLNSSIEELRWDDLIIGAQLKTELQSVIHLLKEPESADNYGIDLPKGILLEGPPGTGKTTLAKVVANTAGLSFFSLRMDEVVSKWVGDSEKNLSRLFEAAQRHAPSVIFIDEVDSIGKNRSSSSAAWADNLLNHLLQLIDGVVKTRGVYVIAATNRSELVDPALKRPGRLNKVIMVPLPNTSNRRRMFELHLSKLNLEGGIDIDALARATHGASGATIKAICNQAGLNAFQREAVLPKAQRTSLVRSTDLEAALTEFSSSVQAPARTANAR